MKNFDIGILNFTDRLLSTFYVYTSIGAKKYINYFELFLKENKTIIKASTSILDKLVIKDI